MRTAIFLSASCISFSIRPDTIFPVSMGMFYVVGLVMFILMDIIDFFQSHTK